MEEELDFPFANCPNCKELKPVVLREIKFDEEEVIEAILCPSCTSILNMDADITIEYYTAEDLEDLGYKLIYEDESE